MISLASRSPEEGPEEGTSNLVEKNGLRERELQMVKKWPRGFNHPGMDNVALARSGVGGSQRTLITKMRRTVKGMVRLPKTGANLRRALPFDVVNSGKTTNGRRHF